MIVNKHPGILLFIFAVFTIHSTMRNPFEFINEPTKQDISQKSVQSAPPNKWIIKECDHKLMILENCEDGQLRAIEIPQLEH